MLRKLAKTSNVFVAWKPTRPWYWRSLLRICRGPLFLLAMLVHSVGMLAAQPSTQPPISLNAALRMSIEQGQSFLAQVPGWMASEYAKSDPVWTLELLFRAGRAAWLLSRSSEMLRYADQLEALGRQAKLPKAQVYALILRSRHSEALSDYRSRVDLLSQAATIASPLQEAELQAFVTAEFCSAYYASTQTKLAQRACERAIQILEDLPALAKNPAEWSFAESDRVLLLANAKNLAFINAETSGQTTEDLARAQEAIALFTALQTPTMVSMVQENLSGYYLEQGDAATAISLSEAALKLEVAQGRFSHAISTLMNLAQAQSQIGQHAKALASLEQALSYAKQIGESAKLSGVYQTQLSVAEASGNLPLAVNAARLSIEALEQDYDERNLRAIAEMEARFQGAEQSREIERLAQDRKIRELALENAKAENAQQAAQIARKNLWLWLVTVSTLGLIVVSVLFWLQWRDSKRYASRMQWLADTDGLTQLLNRRAFIEQFSQSLREQAGNDSAGALAIIDMDHFKQINDTHGHPAGDAALKRSAELIRSGFIELGENVTRQLIVGRLGGEEFGVWVPAIDSDKALALAEKLRSRIAEDHQLPDALGFPMSVSIGIAALSERQQPAVEQWLAAADRALYRAKHLGRNRCVLTVTEKVGNEAMSASGLRLNLASE